MDYNKLKLQELIDECKTRSIKRCTGLRIHDLINILLKDDEDSSSVQKKKKITSPKKLIPKASPKKIITKIPPKKTVTKSPKKIVTKISPKKTVTKSPKKTVTKSPKKIVTKTSPKKTVTKSPKKTVTKSPKKAVTKSPKKAVTKSPKKIVTKTSPKKIVTKTSPKQILSKSENCFKPTPSYFRLSDRICGFLRFDYENGMVKTVSGQECTPLGNKIATSLIRIAATRIFDNPYQSILELPVNSLDAYATMRGEESIGKFGMGFFSILYWLIGFPERRLIIESTFRINSSNCSWTAIINEVNGHLMIDVKLLEPQKQTGTKIILEGTPEFSDVFQFIYQLRRLSNFKNVVVRVKTSTPIKCKRGCVDVLITEKMIKVEDWATGISMETLLNSLLIPSISTKTIQLSTNKNLKDKISVEGTILQYNALVITVGKVIIEEFMYHPVNKNIYDLSYKINLDLSLSTRLPVSRDDILLETKADQKKFIKILYEALDLVVEKSQDVFIFKILLEKYALRTGSTTNSILINNFISNIDDYITSKGFTLVPYENRNLYFSLNLENPVTTNMLSLLSLESLLEKQYPWKSDIYLGKLVYITDLPKTITVSTGATSRFLFINSSIIKKDWITYIADSYVNEKLYPMTDDWSEKVDDEIINGYNKLNEKLGPFNDDIYVAYVSIILKFRMLSYIFNMDVNIWRFIYDFLEYKIFITSLYPNKLESIKEWLSILLSTLDKSTPNNISYGLSFTIRVAYNFSIFREENVYKFNNYENNKIIGLSKELLDISREWNILFLKMLSEWYKHSTKFNLFIQYMIDPIEFYVFNVGGNTFLNFINKLSKKIKSIYDWLAIIFSFIVLSKHDVIKMLNIVDQKTDKLIDVLLDTIHRSLSDISIFNIIEKVVSHNFTNTLYDMANIIHSAVKQFLAYHRDIGKLEIVPFTQITPKYTFNGTDLMEYALTHDLTANNFFQKLPEIENYKSKGTLQALEIAINEGTTRDPIEATLIETVQNSLDALRLAGLDLKININIDLTEDEKSFILKIKDEAGIPTEGIISLKIPFLSTKTASELVTGEMGSGFFNVYRMSKQVKIDTTYNKQRVIIMDTPIRNKHRVTDIKTEITFKNTKKKNQTTIELLYEFENERETIDYITSIYNIINTQLSLINSSIIFNKSEMHMSKVQIDETEDYILYIGDNSKSYILTKGIPFISMDKVDIGEYPIVKDFLLSNIILDLKHASYTPTQSRTKLRMKNTMLWSEHFKTIALLATLWRINSNSIVDPDNYIENFNSPGSSIQLKFNENVYGYSIYTFITYRKYKEYNMAMSINKAIDLRQSMQSDIEIKYILLDEGIPEIMVKVTLLWLINKDKYSNTKEKSIMDKKDAATYILSHPKMDIIKKFTTIFVEVYWKLGKEISKIIVQHFFNKDAPKIKWDSIEKNILGYYKRTEHMIVLNIKYLENFEKISDLLSDFANKKLELLDFYEFTSWFGLRMPSSTLLHELTHAWTSSEHSYAYHDMIYIKIDNKNVIYNFNEGTNYVFEQILKKDFWNEIAKRME
jgi:hypothetical protein